MVRALFFSAAIASAAAIASPQDQPDPRALIPSATLNAIARLFRDVEKTGAYIFAEKK